MSPHYSDREGGLSRFFLQKRVTVLMILCTIIVVGVVAVSGIPIELIPQGYDEPFLWVSVPWQDAPPQEVLDKILTPLEEEVSTLRGVQEVTSLAFAGNARCYLDFKQGTDMDIAYRELKDRIERARARFPADADRVYIRKDDAASIPVAVIGIAIDEDLTDSYNLIQDQVILPLSRLEGVATVTGEALEEKEIIIELDREKAAASGLNIYQLGQELASDNFTLASGNVREGSRKLLLRSIARYDSLEQIENRLVGPAVRLRDVAEVRYEEPKKDYRVRAMSKPAVALVVLKEGQANAREVSRLVTAEVGRMNSSPRLSALEMVMLFNQGDVIDEALGTLFQSGLIGGLIAFLVLYLFLRRMRLTLIVALSIPLSVMIGLTVMFFAGETLNLLSLLALMVCVGLLVDNSVVVAENIHRLHREGLERLDACIRGAGEMGLAITMSTLTTVVVFLPVALVEGPGQFFLMRLALPISVSLIASLFVALVFVPLAVYLSLGNGKAPIGALMMMAEKQRGLLRIVYEQSFGRMNRGYERLLAFFLERRFDLVLAVLAVFVLTGAVTSRKVSFVPIQEDEGGGFELSVEMPAGTTLEEAEEWFLRAEKVVEERKDELGLDGWFVFHRARFGEVQGWFTRPRSTDLTPKEVTKIVKEALPPKPGMQVYAGDEQPQEDEAATGIYTLTIYGDDWRLIEAVGDEVEDVLARVEGVLGPRKSADEAPNELGLVIDRDRAQRYGVNPQVVAGVVGYALRGAALPRYYSEGKEIPVRVRFREEDRESLIELADFLVPTQAGGAIPLAALTDTEFLSAPGRIVRRNKRIGGTITLELEEGKEEETRRRLDAIVAGIDLPEGITFGAGAAGVEFDEDLEGLKFAGALSIVFVFLLMGFLFESIVLPLSIILTIPLSIIGVFWIHFVTGRNIDFLGAVGIVILIGVVVNNGIVMVDYVNRLRGGGMPRRQALLTAAERRFRPILMTAITTIGGMVPLAFAGSNSIGLSYTSFSLTLIGGMTTGTLLTLLVVPVFYTFFDDARETIMARLTRLLPGSGGTIQAAGEPRVPDEAIEPDRI